MERAIGAVYPNYSKAFDTSRHDILLGKLRKCRLNYGKVRLFKNWLNVRCQRTVVNNTESRCGRVSSSVAQ